MSPDILRSHPAYALGQAAEKGGSRVLGAFAALGASLTQALARQRARRELVRLDEHMLRDIGLGRSQALFEADKPFWRA